MLLDDLGGDGSSGVRTGKALSLLESEFCAVRDCVGVAGGWVVLASY